MNVERDRTGRNSSFGSAAANTPNPTQSLTQAMKKQLALLAALLAAASVNAASVIDSFNDVKGATNAITLAQINSTGIGGVGFTSKYEQTGSAVAVLKTNDQAVSLGNYVSGQAANTQHWSVAATPLSSGLARRVQTRSTPAMYSYSPIWFSFLATLQSPAGDVALTFNGTLPTSGQFGAGSAGLRVGLGHFSNANFRGAMGVGPVATATGQAELTNIVNGVNGAVTAAGFAPTNGTPGLVLGRIDNDPNNGSPRVSLWYNPNVPDAASLPAPTLTFTDTTGNIVPSTVTRIGYQVVRSGTLGVQNEMIDNVKVSDDVTAFDIVYKNAALPTPVLNVAATVAQGSEQGPTNIVFTITSDRAVTADLAIPYTLSGAATNGYIPYSAPATYTNADFIDAKFNPDTQSSTVTIPAGQSNATIVLQVLNDTLPEATEPITLTVQPQPSSYILSSGAATASIQDDNDANTSVQCMFERNGLPETWDTNLVALPAAVASGFNFNSTAYINSIFGQLDFPSPSSCLSAAGDHTPDNPVDALAQGSYANFQVAPVAGRTMTLTNFQFMAIYGNYLNQVPTATGAVVFVRSSLDNFATDLGSFVLLPAESIFPTPGWYTNTIALDGSFANLPGLVEFRLYFYDDSAHNQVAVRVDNLFIGATTAPAAPNVQQVFITGTVTNAAEPATPGQFTVTRLGDTSGALTVNYAVTGTASNSVDYVLLPGSVTIPAGQSSANIVVTPINDDIAEPTETVVATLVANPAYGVLATNSATVYLADDGDVGGLVAWFFNENNNTAGSLAAVAAPTRPAASQIVALNAAAGSGLNPFGANTGGANVGHGYGTGANRSSPSSFFARGDHLSTNAATALSDGDYVSFTIGATPGRSLTLTNFSAWLAFSPATNQTAWAFLRSSADGFASDLGTITLIGYSGTSASAYTNFNVPLAVAGAPGAIEFRLYFYCTRTLSYDILRVDDVTFQGSVGNLPPGAQVVVPVASAPNAAEPNTPGAFTLTRYGDATAPLTVNYAIGGTASNGVDYAFLGGTTNFPAGVTNVVVPVVVIDDNRPEPTETVVLTLLPGAGYYLSIPSSATITILDDGDLTPVFASSETDTNAYERLPSLLGSFTVNRTAGDTSGTVTLNFTLGGTAVLGVDYVSSATNSLVFGPGVLTQAISIYPIDNTLVDGNRTVTIQLQSNPAFILDGPTSGTVTIVDDEAPPATVLWSDNFDTAASAAGYTTNAGSVLVVDDYTLDWAFDYSSIGLPPAPHSAGNTTVGLRLDANLLSGAAGVNLYPVGQTFSNDYALRFDLYLSMSTSGPDNELIVFGLNQSGTAINWQSAAAGGGGVYTNFGEGIFATVSTRDGIPNVYNLYAATNTGTAPVLVASDGNRPPLFNSPPYATAGRVNNFYDSTNKTWAECELSQVGGVISLKLNNNVILQYTNATPFTAGNVFLGYCDPFDSLGTTNCFAIIDNARVVALTTVAHPVIRKIILSGPMVTINFTGAAADPSTAFTLQSSSTVSGPYTDDNSALITGSNGSYQATTMINGTARFYRIRR